MVNQLNTSHRSQTRGNEQVLHAAGRIEEAARAQDHALRSLVGALDKIKKSRVA
jgi:methyl-accepting chemotaxis protein